MLSVVGVGECDGEVVDKESRKGQIAALSACQACHTVMSGVELRESGCRRVVALVRSFVLVGVSVETKYSQSLTALRCESRLERRSDFNDYYDVLSIKSQV